MTDRNPIEPHIAARDRARDRRALHVLIHELAALEKDEARANNLSISSVGPRLSAIYLAVREAMRG